MNCKLTVQTNSSAKLVYISVDRRILGFTVQLYTNGVDRLHYLTAELVPTALAATVYVTFGDSRTVRYMWETGTSALQ